MVDGVLCREDSKYQLTFILSAIKFQHDFVNLSLFSYINILKWNKCINNVPDLKP